MGPSDCCVAVCLNVEAGHRVCRILAKHFREHGANLQVQCGAGGERQVNSGMRAGALHDGQDGRGPYMVGRIARGPT